MLFLSNLTATSLPSNFFPNLLKKAKSVLGIDFAPISLTLVGIKKMTQLNKRYRNKIGPTDTISFAFKEVEQFPGKNLLGEIFICPSVVKKNAKKYGKIFREELSWVFVHSLLHLVGFTHGTERKLKKMQILTAKIINSRLP